MNKEIQTKIQIQAPIEKVWEVFTDFNTYPDWNPFITTLKGRIQQGNKIEVLLTPPQSKPMTFKPKVLAFEPRKEFRWKGKLLLKGIFDGEHYFQFQKNEDNSSTFIHGEQFNGILVGMMGKKFFQKIENGFQQMNEALKTQVEEKYPSKIDETAY